MGMGARLAVAFAEAFAADVAIENPSSPRPRHDRRRAALTSAT
jgi:hypothetical protein